MRSHNCAQFTLSLSLFLYCSTIKVDCVTVQTLPVKTVIDDHIQQLFDALLNSLRRSISGDVQLMDGFLNEAYDSLSVRPQSMDEIRAVNAVHKQLSTREPEVNTHHMYITCTAHVRHMYTVQFLNVR